MWALASLALRASDSPALAMAKLASLSETGASAPVPLQARSGAELSSAAVARGGEATAREGYVADLLIAQSQVLETLAKDASLTEMLEVFARTIEAQSEDMLCSILLLEGNTLRHGAAPSLPAEYTRAIDGAAIGPAVGSCGTAAFTKQQVIVADIATHPLWENYRHLALPHGLKACWSTPILGPDNRVLGTFAMYYRTAREPTDHDCRLMEIWTRLAALGITRKQAEESARAEQQLLLHLFKAQEYERKLAAYELHDGVAQYLAGAVMHLESYLQLIAEAPLPAEIEITRHLLQKALQESRRLINGLRPPVLDEHGVVAALEHLIQEQTTPETQIVFEHETSFHRLPSSLETAIFRIAQEALTNAKSHGRSARIEVSLKHDGDRIYLTVRDWGRGFQPNGVSKGHGLRGIRERVRLLGGTVDISSQIGSGTSIRVELPILVPPKTT